MNTNKVNDVVIIGGGLMGCSAAWQLAQAGKQVLMIEKQQPVFTNGSSLGTARMCRNFGPQDDVFTWMQKTSVSEASKLIDFLNNNSDTQHSMDEIFTTSPVTYVFKDSQRDYVNTLVNAPENNSAVQYASNPAEADKLLGMSTADGMHIVRERRPHSGTVSPHAFIEKMRLGFILSGGQIRYEEAVTEIRRNKSSYTICCGDTRIECRQLVSAAGPFTGSLLRDIAPEFQDIVEAKRVPLAYFKPKEASYSRLSDTQKRVLRDAYPMSTMDSPSYFTMIERWEDDRPVIKMGGHWMRSEVKDLDTVWDQELSHGEIATFLQQTVDYLQSNKLPLDADDLEYVQGYSCVYTLTQDEVPTVRHALLSDGSADPNFVVIAGLSGRGANGTLGYGLLAADMLCGRPGDSSPMYVKSRQVLNGELVLDNSLITSAMTTVG